MDSDHSLPADYVSRDVPSYFDDETGDVLWQPDVYRTARMIADRLDARIVIDLGCGAGTKMGVFAGHRMIGVDLPGPNLREFRARFPDATALEFDLGSPNRIPLDDVILDGALVVCSDVIEHVPDPAPLLRFVARATLAGASVVLSTPERAITWGSRHRGPPPNEAHVREWSLEELRSLLASFGIEHVCSGLTRSNDASALLATSIVGAFPDVASRDRCADLIERHRADAAGAALVSLRDQVLEAEEALAEALALRTEAEQRLAEATRSHSLQTRATVAEHDRRFAASTTWHEQHLADTSAWYEQRIESIEAHAGTVAAGFLAEIDRRDREIAELRAQVDDATRART